jgi:hypothetical protein
MHSPKDLVKFIEANLERRIRWYALKIAWIPFLPCAVFSVSSNHYCEISINAEIVERPLRNIGRGLLCEKVLRKAISWQPPGK